MRVAAAGAQASTFAGEQNVPGSIGALSRKLSLGCLKPLDEPQACVAVCASEDACIFCVSARRLMQAAAARKQASTFAGEQNVPGSIGALFRKLLAGCLKPLEEGQVCISARCMQLGTRKQALPALAKRVRSAKSAASQIRHTARVEQADEGRLTRKLLSQSTFCMLFCS